MGSKRDLVARPLHQGAPPALVSSSRVHPFLSEPNQVLLNFFFYSFAAPFFFSMFGRPFSYSFRGITPWYVIPPPIQFIFDMMLSITRKMFFLVSPLMHENSVDFQFFG
jgi:hypothetical protein